ncbi:LysR family transcriptional regulator [Sphingomonas sp. MAH-20]|uniref:LysR family transcriptional regulator n=1 Tax=Sphingomonas horti TaxID=2682842 RepID=A0A6I4IZB7_9SPHN|nr:MULTISPECIES: LysR substrate-binding domain-containing protein [Sphingomonas]MBA2920686.1 LysR family transcriptional regulator [Sphingomonas sp. CGMCC 1.13658]MVO77622.1 LysR family transcriptional regulator [Sphingomonas horti]
MRRLPPLTAVEAFVQTARLGSLKAAAEELALSSPALSRRIQALERFLGRALFDRAPGAMRPNGDGEKLLQAIAPHLNGLSDAIEAFITEGTVLRLRLGVLPLFASQQIFPHIAELRALHPELHLDIDTGGHALARLGDGLDAAIVLARDIDPALYACRLDRNRILAIGAKSLGKGPGAIARPADLARTTVFLHRDMPDTFDAFCHALGIDGIEPLAIDHFDSGQLMLEAAAQGLGVAFMHESHFVNARDDRLVRLFDAEVDSPYSYWFACRPRALELRAVQLFRDWLTGLFGTAGERAAA